MKYPRKRTYNIPQEGQQIIFIIGKITNITGLNSK